MPISTIKRTWLVRCEALSEFVTHPAVVKP